MAGAIAPALAARLAPSRADQTRGSSRRVVRCVRVSPAPGGSFPSLLGLVPRRDAFPRDASCSVVGDAADPPARLPLPPSTRSHRASRPSTVVANTPRVRGSGPLARPPSPPGHTRLAPPADAPPDHVTDDTSARDAATAGNVAAASRLAPPPDALASEYGSNPFVVRIVGACACVLLGLAADPRVALAGFGAPTGAASSPPLPDSRLVEILKLDREAATRKATLVRTGDLDILLQELNALTMLDERALEAADAELALRAAESLSETMREATTNAETSDVGAQRTRLLERRRTQAEFQEKLLRRKVVEGKLQAQSQWVVYGAALGASVLSTVVMHPVDTVKVRKQAAKTTTKTTTHTGRRPTRSEDQPEESEVTSVTKVTKTPVPAGVGVEMQMEMKAERRENLDASLSARPSAAVHPSAPTVPVDIFAPLGVPMTPAGIASLYDGLLADVVKEGPPLALYLGIYEALKTAFLATDLQSSPVTCYLLAGAFGELAGSVLRVPAEAVKSTQQSDASLTLRDALEVNFATAEGRANCVVAWRAAVTRDVPFGAAQIAIFEGLKVTLAGIAGSPLDGDSFLGEAILGAVGGGVGALISAPADVVVTRLIKQQSAAEAGETRLSATEMAARIRREGGLAAFFTGAGERVLYWAPAVGIFLTAYCRIRHALL